MGIIPIHYDVTFMFYFNILGLDPIAYEHDDLFDILGISQFHMFYIYDFMCWVWTLKHILDKMFCVKRGALEHMSN